MTESMSMTEMTKALRCCASKSETCSECEYQDEYSICVDKLMQDAATTIDRLTAELTEYRSLAAEYGIDGQTMLALAKSQIATARENARLTERLEMAKKDIRRCMELLEKIHGHWPCELCSKDGRCVTCHPVWRGEESE